MGFTNCCKECSCWCLFSMSSILMLVMFSLVLRDTSLISEQKALIQEIVNTPIPQLSCIEICESWYTQQKGAHCCDRYNMDLCVAKQKCKIDYLKSSEVAIKNIENDEFHQISVGIVCGFFLLMIAFRKGKKKSAEKVQQSQNNMMQMMRDMVNKIQKQKRDDTLVIFKQEQDESQAKNNITFQTREENQSQVVSSFMSQSIGCPQLMQYVRNHSCQQCIKSPNK